MKGQKNGMGRKWKIKFHSINAILNLPSVKKFGIGPTFYKVTIHGGKNFCNYKKYVRQDFILPGIKKHLGDGKQTDNRILHGVKYMDATITWRKSHWRVIMILLYTSVYIPVCQRQHSHSEREDSVWNQNNVRDHQVHLHKHMIFPNVFNTLAILLLSYV